MGLLGSFLHPRTGRRGLGNGGGGRRRKWRASKALERKKEALTTSRMSEKACARNEKVLGRGSQDETKVQSCSVGEARHLPTGSRCS